MTQYLLNMLNEYFYFVLCFIVFVIILASLSKKIRKFVYFSIVMGIIYIALVGLYKCGVGITSLYNFSKGVIFACTIIFKQKLGESILASIIVERLIYVISFLSIDNFNLIVIVSEFASEITVPYVIATIRTKLRNKQVENKIVRLECSYSKKIINYRNPIYLLNVSFRN